MSVFTAKLERFRGRRVLVLGLGRSGVGAYRLLAPVASVRVADAKPLEDLSAEARALVAEGVVSFSVTQDETVLGDADLVVRSPGVPWTVPVLAAARQANVEVIGEMELAYRLLPTDRLIAVTGSNGKSTTTALLGDIFRRAGADVCVAGNIGVALSSVVAGLQPHATVVVEVSSFQLEDAVEFKPHVGVLLNLAPDHLDRHGDTAAYYRLKWRLFENQVPGDYAILNADDDAVADGRDRMEAEVLLFGERAAGGPGVWLENGTLRYKVRGASGVLLPAAEIRLPGRHNASNAMAAAAAALTADAPPRAITSSLRSFPGLPHRLEDAGTVAGVTYVNDSKATNVASAVVAIRSYDAPVVLIAGGKTKGEDFSPLATAAAGRVRVAVLYGSAREEIAAAFEGVVPYVKVNDIPEAVNAAAAAASRGDVVLLAPACTSWDQYRSYEERGDDFKKTVGDMASGAPL